MSDLQFSPDLHWGYTLLLSGILALLVLILGVWLGRATKRRDRAAPAVPPPPPTPAPQVPNPADRAVIDRLAAQRAALIGGCVRARGLMDDQVLTDVLDDALRGGGVHIVDPTGYRANPTEHRTAGTEPASAPNQDGIVSRTLRPGFVDAGRVVRAADVVVFKWEN